MPGVDEYWETHNLAAVYDQADALSEAVRDLYAAIKDGIGDDDLLARRKAFVQDAERAVRTLYLIAEDVEMLRGSLQNVIDLCDSIAIAEWTYRDASVEYWEYDLPVQTSVGTTWAPEGAIHRKIIGREDASDHDAAA